MVKARTIAIQDNNSRFAFFSLVKLLIILQEIILNVVTAIQEDKKRGESRDKVRKEYIAK